MKKQQKHLLLIALASMVLWLYFRGEPEQVRGQPLPPKIENDPSYPMRVRRGVGRGHSLSSIISANGSDLALPPLEPPREPQRARRTKPLRTKRTKPVRNTLLDLPQRR
jgi:hypothetical protein